MGYCINYLEFDGSESKSEIIAACEKDSKYRNAPLNEIRFLDKEFDSEQEARNYIMEVDTGFRDCIAVKYKTPVWNESVQDAHEKVSKMYKQYKSLVNTEITTLVPEKMIECKNCCSTLNRAYLDGFLCPVCHRDLRPESFQKKLQKAVEEYKQAGSEYEEAKKQSARKSKGFTWLVKIGYTV